MAGSPLVTATDAQLVQRALAGEQAAFRELVDRHSPACLRYATRVLGNRHDAEDVVQDSFVRAFRALDRYDPQRDFRGWLFAIVVNRCRSAAVVRSRRWNRLVPEAAEHRQVPVREADARHGELEEVQEALAQLDPALREAFLLKYVEDMSYDEMSRVTGVGAPALRMRAMRACRRLRALLTGEDAPDA
ncbi:MAG: polymerase sigma factor, sigma-70 family [Gemmatimonadetes bacterium]|nr:polymerase sigma factor, sigma-70 family [Gemmatimonadota bacterium]